jgi:hypothetical protein
MEDKGKISFLKIFRIYVGISLIANITAIISMMPIYKIMRSENDWALLNSVLKGTDQFTMPIAFLIPMVITFLYLYPVYYPLFPWN